MQILRIMCRFCGAMRPHPPSRSRMFAMIRMPLATASLLAIAIALAGCGDKDKENSTAATQIGRAHV